MNCLLCKMTSGIDFHHTIPRSYGGENSPQVPLCSGHHTLVHTLANELYRTGREDKLTIPADVDAPALALKLVRTIVVARRAFEAERKAGKVERKGSSVRFDGRRMTKLADLARLLGCSQQKAAETAIDRLHQSLTAKEGATR